MYRRTIGYPAGAGGVEASGSRAVPWPELAEGWTAAERTEYLRATPGAPPLTTGAAPALLRESLLSIGGEQPEHDDVRRELARLTRAGPGAAAG